MSVTISIFIISLVAATLGAITAFSAPLKNLAKKGLRRLTFWGYVVIACSMALITAPLFQKHFEEKEQDFRDSVQNVANDKRYAAIKHSFDSSLTSMKAQTDADSRKTAGVISETLGKYGFALDSSKQLLISLQSKVENPGVPVLGLPVGSATRVIVMRPDASDPNLLHATLYLQSRDAGSSNLKIISSAAYSEGFGKPIYYIPTEDKKHGHSLFDQTLVLSKNQIIGAYFNIGKPADHGLIYFWVRGSYSKLDGKEPRRMSEVYFYNIASQTSNLIKDPTRKEVIELVKKMEK